MHPAFFHPGKASGFEDNRLSFVTDEAGLLSDEEWSKLEGRSSSAVRAGCKTTPAVRDLTSEL